MGFHEIVPFRGDFPRREATRARADFAEIVLRDSMALFRRPAQVGMGIVPVRVRYGLVFDYELRIDVTRITLRCI